MFFISLFLKTTYERKEQNDRIETSRTSLSMNLEGRETKVINHCTNRTVKKENLKLKVQKQKTL